MIQKVSLQQLINDLNRLEKEAANDITVSSDRESLESLRIKFLGSPCNIAICHIENYMKPPKEIRKYWEIIKKHY